MHMPAHHRQEARPRAAAPEILDEPFRKHGQPYDVQERQPHAQRRVEPKQQTCADGIIQQVQATDTMPVDMTIAKLAGACASSMVKNARRQCS